MEIKIRSVVVLLLAVCLIGLQTRAGADDLLRAGIARVEITDCQAGKVHDPCYAMALVLQAGKTTSVLVTLDAVAIGEIGRIRNDFLAKVRRKIAKAPCHQPPSFSSWRLSQVVSR